MKKILALVLVAVMALSMFAACGETTPATTDAPVDGGNDVVDAGTITLGGIGPTTGGAAIYGTAVMNAMKLAVDEINAAGGVNGMKFEALWQDDEHNAEKSVNAYQTLMDKGMQVLIGTVTSAPCIAVVAEAELDNIFMITPSGSAVDAIAAPNAFRVCFSDPNQGVGAADYIKNNNVGEKVAVIYNVSDPYSNGIYEKFAAQAGSIGLEIVAAEAFTNDSATDFSVQIQKVKDSGADLLFLPIYYEAAALILDQANSAGLDVKYFGCDGLDGVIGQLGDKAALAEGVMLLTPFAADATDDKTVAFTTAYKNAYGEIPNQFAADAYDAVYIVKAAIEAAGIKNADISCSDLCDAIIEQMATLKFDGVTGLMTWDVETGEPTKEPKAMVIKDGAYAAM
ncbi:MAG: ABC transporter substrate-binding protein [Clostridia bacterium]|nr:ABC transporter substrate-binding protein [Clostridia bacterium]MBQ6614085.1 ABC transporter substrate-binding protein [Clostridia bacterium]